MSASTRRSFRGLSAAILGGAMLVTCLVSAPPAIAAAAPAPVSVSALPTGATATRPSPEICVDEVGVLGSATCARITAVLDRDEELTTDEIAVLMVDTTGDETIEHYATRTFNAWGIGKAGKDNGILLLVAVDDRALRIEVGTGLEKALTDGEAEEIIYGTITPEFKQGDYRAGILAGLDAIRRALKHTVTSNNSLTVATEAGQPRATRTQYVADRPDDDYYTDDPETTSDNSLLWFALLVIILLVSWAASAYRKPNGYDDSEGSGGRTRRSSYRSRGFSSAGGSSRSSGSSHRSSSRSGFGGGRSRSGGGSGSW